MLVKKKNNIYSNKRNYIHGSGFMDGIGSYILENKDLIAKPLLGAVGNIGAMALTEGSKVLLSKLTNGSKKASVPSNVQLDEKSKQIISELLKPKELTKGSGIKKF